MNKSRIELLRKFAIELNQIHLINVAKYDAVSQSQIDSTIAIDKISLVTNAQICYEVPAEKIVFSSPNEYFNFSFQIVRVYEQPPNDDYHTFYSWCWNFEPMSIGLHGHVLGEVIDAYLLKGLLSNRRTLGADTVDILQMLPITNVTKRCSKTITQAMCKHDCALSAVAQQCGCLPFGETFYDESETISNMG